MMKKLLILTLLFAAGVSCKKKQLQKNCCSGIPFVEKFDGGYIAIPNIFTPNGDGINDYLEVPSEGIISYSFKIINKLGVTQYESTSATEYWDGSVDGKTKNDQFSYQIEIETLKGKTYVIMGEVCSIVDDNACLDNAENCVYGNQWNGNSFSYSLIEVPFMCD